MVGGNNIMSPSKYQGCLMSIDCCCLQKEYNSLLYIRLLYCITDYYTVQ